MNPQPSPHSRSSASATTQGREPSKLVQAMCISIGLSVVMAFVATRHRLHSAEVALASGDYRDALKLAEIELKSEPNSSQALLVAGYAAQGLKQPELARFYFARILDEGDANTTRAFAALAQIAFQHARASEAEQLFRWILNLDPDHSEARERLIYLLVLEGRIWEAQQLIFRTLQSGRVDVNHLMVAASNRIQLSDGDGFIEACRAAVPDDLIVLFPSARLAYRNHDLQQARRLLEGIATKRPDLLDGQALFGTLLAETDDFAAFSKWHENLPANADDHPGIWFGRGVWAMKTNQHASAVRCFAETLIRQPGHVAANYQLSQALAALGQESQAIEVGNRARDLSRLEFLIGETQMGWNDDLVAQIVALLETLGRPWEAAAWCHAVQIRGGQMVWPQQTLRRLSPTLDQCRSSTIDSANLVHRFGLTKYALPDWKRQSPVLKPTTSHESPASQVAFTDEAENAGVRFTYQNGATSGDRESMFEFDGGGIAVLDYDGDRWPDIYLTQGGPLPPEATPRTIGDCMYRNMGDGHFVEVAIPAGLGDTSYSQGVTSGDFNDDGFPDIYVANIGPNTFYRNNGDGTFEEVSRATGTAGNEWTSSCVLADVNGDSLPDLYVVNYLAGDELRSRPCFKTLGQRCHPSLYRAAQDRLYLNLGDGRFEDITSQAGIQDDDGRGLGIVAADFDHSRRISLFVGNDMSRNFYFANQTPSRGAAPLFTELALLRGVAVDSRGHPKASMGIAAGDANGDGLLDLFITNFYRESTDLYLQQPDHTFRDATREANLSESGFHMLGWGAQFIDGELDGLLDLIVTNGHVHAPSDPAVPYRMPSQYFRNAGNCRFEEQHSNTVGDFFAGNRLGRSLARLDWNRDGLEEACISHLDSPAALLLNRTADHGHFLAIRLVGVKSDRDAIGTRVDITADGHKWSSQLTAGDGYQASNERRLVFGLGVARNIDHVEVHWTAGGTQSVTDLQLDREYIVIEGRAIAVEN